LSQCEHFADNGGGVNYSRFCADVFYGRPLTTVNFHNKVRDPWMKTALSYNCLHVTLKNFKLLMLLIKVSTPFWLNRVHSSISIDSSLSNFVAINLHALSPQNAQPIIDRDVKFGKFSHILSTAWSSKRYVPSRYNLKMKTSL